MKVNIRLNFLISLDLYWPGLFSLSSVSEVSHPHHWIIDNFKTIESMTTNLAGYKVSPYLFYLRSAKWDADRICCGYLFHFPTHPQLWFFMIQKTIQNDSEVIETDK